MSEAPGHYSLFFFFFSQQEEGKASIRIKLFNIPEP
jgi:hypothetical protein